MDKIKHEGIQFLRIMHLNGPNIWTYRPVIEAWVDIGLLENFPSHKLPGFNERLIACLPSLIEHKCGIGVRGGFIERLHTGTWIGHILEHVALELQCLAGMETRFGKTRSTTVRGIYKVAFRTDNEHIGRTALDMARSLILATIDNTPYNIESNIARLHEKVNTIKLAPSAQLSSDSKQHPIVGITSSQSTSQIAQLIHWFVQHENNLEPTVVLNSSRTILSHGLAYDRCDVGIVTDATEYTELAEFYIEEPDHLHTVLRTQVDVIRPTGFAILNAAEPLLVEIADLCDGGVIFYTLNHELDIISDHQNKGGRAVFLKNNHVVLAEGLHETPLLPLTSLNPKTQEQQKSLLAAVAAGWALGITPKALTAGLITFELNNDAILNELEINI